MFPSFSQFSRWASQHNAIPLWIEPQLPSADLLEWVHSLTGQQQRFFLLHSAPRSAEPEIAPESGVQADLPRPPAGQQARYSYFSLDAPRYTSELQDGGLYVRYHADSGARADSLKVGNPFERFHDWFRTFNAPRVDGLPPFWGGAVGYLGYEASRFLEPRLAKLFASRRRKEESLAIEKFGDLEFAVYDAVGIVDHARGRLWLVYTVFLPAGKRLSPQQIERVYRLAQDRLRRYAVDVQKAVNHKRAWGLFKASEVRSNRSEAAYRLMVRRAKGFISAGELYQCNLSQSLSASWEGDPWSLYRQLTTINPSPYAALWRSSTRWIASASPELLLRLEADRIETRPIAGTYPRPSHPWDDRKVAEALRQDAKERAEHVMLVDLERNDLGRVCLPQSVQVSEALAMEMYSHVIHLVSDIRGRLTPGKTWGDAIRACFPGGTITGCPKIRCMELIHRLESHRRGPYTGSLGWIGFTGDMTLNILIRTFFLDKNRLSFPVGAGIVADSDAQREYHETLHKAQALLQALHGQGVLKGSPRRRS